MSIGMCEMAELCSAGRAADIRASFGDAELILSLGCESVLNLPVVFEDRATGRRNRSLRSGK